MSGEEGDKVMLASDKTQYSKYSLLISQGGVLLSPGLHPHWGQGDTVHGLKPVVSQGQSHASYVLYNIHHTHAV